MLKLFHNHNQILFSHTYKKFQKKIPEMHKKKTLIQNNLKL